MISRCGSGARAATVPLWVLLLTVCVVLLALAGATPVKAVAAGIAEIGSGSCAGPDPDGCTSEFRLSATQGYRITVSGRSNSTGYNVLVDVHGHHASTLYYARGRVTPTRIRASLGRLGMISLRFRPSGTVRRVKVPRKCIREQHPAVIVARLGTFVGRVRFVGEGGYTGATAHRIRGGIGDPLAVDQTLDCEQGPRGLKRRQARGVHLEAATTGPYGDIAFEAWAGVGWAFRSTTRSPASSGNAATFTVSDEERREDVLVSRVVVASAPAAEFHFDTARGSAEVTPPVPFTGSGVLQEAPDGSTLWTGDLSVAFPGIGSVPLVGPTFTSRLADDPVIG
jgi:hypothetical protein